MPKVSRLTGRTKSSLLGARRNRVIWHSLLRASSESLQTKIDDLAGSAATTEADLLEGRCRNSCEGTCRLRKIAKGIVGRDRHVGKGDRHHRKGDERRIFVDVIAEGWQRLRGSQCNGTGIVDQFCRRHQTDGAGAKFTEFW